MKPGDVVTVTAGGPDMTVETVSADRIFVAWFDRDAELHRADFPAIALRPSTQTVPAGFSKEDT